MSRTYSSSMRAETQKRSPRAVTVFVIDPDAQAAEFVAGLVASRRIPVEQFDSGESFWAALSPDTTGCVVLEVDLPGISGIQLQERMAAAGSRLPIVMVAAEADVAIAVRAMKSGAVDFLQKPCHPLELWEAIQAALERDQQNRKQKGLCDEIRNQLETLSDEEYLVMRLVLEGQPKKAIARQLDLSLRTIDFRRSSILRKMQVGSTIDLAKKLALIDDRPQAEWLDRAV